MQIFKKINLILFIIVNYLIFNDNLILNAHSKKIEKRINAEINQDNLILENKIAEILGLSKIKIENDNRFLSYNINLINKHQWNSILNQVKLNNDLANFILLMRSANCAKIGLNFNEVEIFNFFNKKYGINNNLILSKLTKSSNSCIVEQINENNINNNTISQTPKSIINKFKKNKSIIHDKNFVRLVKKTWHTKKFLNNEEEFSFFENFKKILHQLDHEIRFDNMINDGNFESSNNLLNKISHNKKNLARYRIEILNSKSPNQIYKILNILKTQNSNLYKTSLLDAIHWFDHSGLYNNKFELIKRAVNEFNSFDKNWIKLFKENKRELLSSNHPEFIKTAYQISSIHNEKIQTTDFVEAEFFAGFIAFKYLRNYKLALKHFQSSYKNAENPNRVSRAAYWSGLSLSKINQINPDLTNKSQYWFQIGAKNFTSFYGQLCVFELNNKSNPIPIYLSKIDKNSLNRVKNNPIFPYYYYALLLQNKDLSNKIAKIFVLFLGKKSDIAILAKLANAFNMPLTSIFIGNIAKKHLNMTIIEALYPSPSYKNLKYREDLVYSIIHKESAFDDKVSGLAGEYGLMQIMPKTAEKISRQIGLNITQKNLFDKNINTLIGSQYIKNLQNRYSNLSLLSIAAYNAGEKNVDKWISLYGNPRYFKNYLDIISWIENTHFKTTRYYMQTVLANYIIYQTILNPSKKINITEVLFN